MLKEQSKRYSWYHLRPLEIQRRDQQEFPLMFHHIIHQTIQQRHQSRLKVLLEAHQQPQHRRRRPGQRELHLQL